MSRVKRKELQQVFLKNGMLDKDIEIIYKEKKAKEWFIVFSAEEITRKEVELQKIKINETTCITLEKLTQKNSHWLPAYISDDFSYEFFNQYGTVQHIQGTWSIDSRVYTGMREVYLRTNDESKHQIPHDNGINMLIACPGRFPICLKCHRLGHARQECPNGTIGRRVSLYADVLVSATRAGTSGKNGIFSSRRSSSKSFSSCGRGSDGFGFRGCP